MRLAVDAFEVQCPAQQDRLIWVSIEAPFARSPLAGESLLAAVVLFCSCVLIFGWYKIAKYSAMPAAFLRLQLTHRLIYDSFSFNHGNEWAGKLSYNVTLGRFGLVIGGY